MLQQALMEVGRIVLDSVNEGKFKLRFRKETVCKSDYLIKQSKVG